MSGESAPPERVIARLRPHGRAMFWPSVALILIAGATGYFAGTFALAWQNSLLFAVAAIAVVLLWIVPLIAWLGRRYTITTRRLILRSGLLVRVRQELLHSRGYDITVRRTGLQSAFRSGTIVINSGLDHPIVLRDVPGADLVQAVLHDLMEANENPIAARRQQDASRGSDETTFWGVR